MHRTPWSIPEPSPRKKGKAKMADSVRYIKSKREVQIRVNESAANLIKKALNAYETTDAIEILMIAQLGRELEEVL